VLVAATNLVRGADPVTRSGRSYAVTGVSINRATAAAAAVPAEQTAAVSGFMYFLKMRA
jgi:hypothetical protein